MQVLELTGSVTGAELRKGMRICASPVPATDKEVHTVPAFTGRCDSGLHFGSGCYNTISTWYVFELVDVTHREAVKAMRG